jgi:regulator of replication initiation timing
MVLAHPPADVSIETFIRENSALHLENEKLVKLVKQKKTEVELWKSKYENQMGQVIQVFPTSISLD